MRYLRSLSWCVFVISFAPQLASADEPSSTEWAKNRVEAGIVQPLAQRTGKRFSRERPAPRERRVRITQLSSSRDAQGREFIRFAVDARFGETWQQGDVVGCVYRSSGSLFIQRGDAYFPASFLFGKPGAAVAGVCRPITRG